VATASSAALGRPTRRRTGGAGTALFRRAFLDARTRTIAFAYVFAVYSWLQAAGFRSTYPTAADRLAFARSFAGNDAIRLFYGYPYDVVTLGGYCAWRVGGTLAIAAAVYGVLASVRALRTEEEAGRTELVLAGPVRRRTAFLASTAAIAAGTGALWAAEFVGFLAGRLPVAGSAYLALATASVVPVFAGAGAVASQLLSTRRHALAAGTGVVMVFWLVRVVADTVPGGGWLRWATPLGWAEEVRPFAGPRPAALLLLGAAAVPPLVAAARVAARRDVGSGLVPVRDQARPRRVLLSSPTAQALRSNRGVLAAWVLGVLGFSAVLGKISTSISSAGISTNIQKDLAKFGAGPILTPTGYLSFIFVIFVLAISLFACGQAGDARAEESGEQLETLLALPVSRYRWLAGRLLVAAVAAAVLSLLAGLLTWAGAASQGVEISLPRLIEAGANCIPTALLFLGLGALAYALLPRASTAISYGLVTASFLWYLVGSVLGLPQWVVDLTPFRHIGLVPAQPFQATGAVVMVVVGAAAGGAALGVFRRRDLVTS
jgi:ABC-2 type transport system permease protein